ncbi:MAG: ribosome recycling factor [Armatimonadota bacterium]
MVKAVEAAQHDYSTIRTGRANPTILDRVTVDYFGTQMPINQLASISIPEPRQILIAPWDRSVIPLIEKAILKSDIGLNPNTDGAGIRLNIPSLTEERRKEFIKTLHKKAEEHRVSVRNIRRDANEDFKKLEKGGDASEDEVKRAQEQIQKMTDKYIDQIEHLTKAKEAELLEV